jgi:hypothetical protein
VLDTTVRKWTHVSKYIVLVSFSNLSSIAKQQKYTENTNFPVIFNIKADF